MAEMMAVRWAELKVVMMVDSMADLMVLSRADKLAAR